MGYLFDTDALSELTRRRPTPAYVAWLREVPEEAQFASAISAGELYRGAYRATDPGRWLARIETILGAITVLPYDREVARTYGEIRADLERAGRLPGEADLQIAATALHHGLVVVTGNVRHFERVPGLRVDRIFEDLR